MHYKALLFIFLMFTTLPAKPLLIFDINSLIPCRDSLINALKRISKEHNFTLLQDTSCYYNVPMGHLLSDIGIPENAYKYYVNKIWNLFISVQPPPTTIFLDVSIWKMLQKLNQTFELAIITPNEPHTQSILTYIGLDTYIKRIITLPAPQAIQIKNGFCIVPTHTDYILNFVQQQHEISLFVTQSLDFAYSLYKVNLWVIGGGWHWNPPQVFEQYVPNLKCAATPSDLPAIADEVYALAQYITAIPLITM